MKLHKHFYVAIAILVVSTVVGEEYFRWLVGVGLDENVPLAASLSTIPQKMGAWEGTDQPIDPVKLIKIGSKDLVSRVYKRGGTGGDVLSLYVVYFGGVRGTAPHRPDVCMPGGGWNNISNEIIPLKVPGFGDEALMVHKDVFEDDKMQKRQVVWWEYVHGRNVASRMLQRILWALPPALGGKRGSVLQVQIANNFKGDTDESMRLITEFMNVLGPHIERVLPGNGPGGTPGAGVVPAATTETASLERALSTVPGRFGNWQTLEAVSPDTVMTTPSAEDVLRRVCVSGTDQVEVCVRYYADVDPFALGRPDVLAPGGDWKRTDTRVVGLEVPGLTPAPPPVYRDTYEYSPDLPKKTVVWWQSRRGRSELVVEIAPVPRSADARDMDVVRSFIDAFAPELKKVLSAP